MQTANLNQPHQRIYLNGFMGSGKSTVGPLLAELLDWTFVDLDHQIEHEIAGSISAFFKQEGETAFRAIESRELRRTEAMENCVISVGGGALCSEANLQWALDHGVVVLLDTSIKETVRRLMEHQRSRPMLLDDAGRLLSHDAVTERISGLMTTRRPFYTRSHHAVVTDDKFPKEIADAIFRLIG